MRQTGTRRGFSLTALSAVLMAAIVLAGCGSSAAAGNEETGRNENSAEAFEWFYGSFDDTQKAAYDAFRTAADSPFASDPVTIGNEQDGVAELSVSDLDTVYQGFLYDHPEIFWLSSSYSYRVSGSAAGEETADAVSVIPIPETAEELDLQIREFESAAQNMLDRAEKADGDRERAEILYRCLTDEIEYEEEALYDSTLQNEHTAYGAIAKKEAVCDGFALAYKYLLDRCGIKCILIPGTSEGMPHVWNTVFWDNAWHEADPTWDAASEADNRGQYFDLTTEEMNKDHTREADGIALLIPAAE